jgi:glutathione S-transferase
VNPNLKVPVLVHDGHAIFESAAIQIYLGETFGVEKGLYPAPGPARGDAMKWLVWANVSLGEAVQRWLRNTDARFDAKEQNAAAGATARKDIDALLAMLNSALDKKSYILGEVSIVDFHLASFMQWLTMMGIGLTAFPNMAAWLERCSARPALAKLAA